MNSSDGTMGDLPGLMDKLLDGLMSKEDFKRLDSILHRRPEALRYYFEKMEVHILLSAKFDSLVLPQEISDHLDGDSASFVQTSIVHDLPDDCRDVESGKRVEEREVKRDKGVRVNIVERSPGRRRYALVCILLLVASVFSFVLFRSKQDAVVVESIPLVKVMPEKSVGEIVNLSNAKWGGPRKDLVLGSLLTTGPFALDAGLAEIRMKGGAGIIMEGPVEFSLKSEYDVFLREGKITVIVPPGAKRSTVTTPSCKVVDLGNTFGVRVEANGETEVHVIEGRVQASPSYQGSIFDLKLVKAREAIYFSGSVEDIVKTVAFQGGTFRTSLPKRIAEISLDYMHWPFDEHNGDIANDHGQRSDGKFFPAYLTRLGLGEPGQGERAAGKFGLSFSLDASGSYFATNKVLFLPNVPLSVAFWFKSHAGALDRHARPIVAWGELGASESWQIAINRNEAYGVKGAVRVSLNSSDTYVTGASSIKDGQWHHVVCNFFNISAEEQGDFVKIYIDGVENSISAVNVSLSDRKTGKRVAMPVFIGKGLLEGDLGSSPLLFDGMLDELYIFNGLLAEPDIYRLMQSNFIK